MFGDSPENNYKAMQLRLIIALLKGDSAISLCPGITLTFPKKSLLLSEKKIIELSAESDQVDFSTIKMNPDETITVTAQYSDNTSRSATSEFKIENLSFDFEYKNQPELDFSLEANFMTNIPEKAADYYCGLSSARKMAYGEYIANLNLDSNSENIVFAPYKNGFCQAIKLGKAAHKPSIFTKFFGGFTKEKNEKQLDWYKQELVLLLESYLAERKTQAELSVELSQWVRKNKPGLIAGLFNQKRKQFFQDLEKFTKEFKEFKEACEADEKAKEIEVIEQDLYKKIGDSSEAILSALLQPYQIAPSSNLKSADKVKGEEQTVTKGQVPALAKAIYYGSRQIKSLAKQHPEVIKEHKSPTPSA